MSQEKSLSGPNIPQELYAVIEITPETRSVKYEFDKESGLLCVDRFMPTCMIYPCLYGYVPNTLADDGDALDILVLAPDTVLPGSRMTVRPIGVLLMSDEAGQDSKILAVPTVKSCQQMAHINTLDDLVSGEQNKIQHFFEHYKDLEPGKWVKIDGWGDVAQAHAIIEASASVTSGSI